MSDTSQPPQGPDLAAGVDLTQLADGAMLAGHVGDKPVLVVRRGDELFAIGASCTHYSGPLGDGVLSGDMVRCPWHHACFDVRTGEAVRAPALAPVACWDVERRDGRVYVTRERPASDGATPLPGRRPSGEPPRSVVIVGAGAAGNAAAEMLRREGYDGPVTMVGADPDAPYDRPNLSKDYLAGTASEDWIPLRPPGFYADHRIDLRTGRRVTAIDTAARRVTLDDGRTTLDYDALVLATGADPVRLPAGADGAMPVRYLRTLADSRALIAAAGSAKRVVVIGASFIWLEVAASLRTRGLEVHVVAPDKRPMERVLGSQLGDFVRGVHEKHGVVFHLGHTAKEIGRDAVTLDDGQRIAADFVVAGIGVRPNLELATQAGLAQDRGVVVNEYLETSASAVYAAGDIARYPDPISGERIRVEHWVVAERQGQTAARNILGRRERFDVAPFFWSNHYDTAIGYVGHAERWDDVRIDGDVAAGDCKVSYVLGGRTLAVATVGRDRANLEAEVSMEQGSLAAARGRA